MNRPAAMVLADRYELAGVLGVGGMGSVYRARDRELDEIVALKVLRRELIAQPGMVERFKREVKLARRVTHRNVARVFDIGDHAGEKFITMELVEGESLGARLSREGALPLRDVLTLVGEIAEGLSAAHAAGVIHRDLKPDNVLLGLDGRVVISDFGIARAAAFAGNANRTLGLVLGTPDYMAPEQLENASGTDARADLYALGAMLFEMLTGHAPFKGESALAIATARLLGPAPDPRNLAPEIPDALARLVGRLLARKPDDRPASVAEVQSTLASMTVPATFARRPSFRPMPAPARAPQRIAVVPLATEQEGLAWLGYGLSELVADALDGRPGVDVRARGARLSAPLSKNLRSLGDDLGVPLVVGGTVSATADNGVLVEMQLVNVLDGFVLWSRSFGVEARTETIASAAHAADEIAQVLLLGSRPHVLSSADERAVTSCLRARFEASRGDPDAVDRAIALYERAITRAPEDPWVNASYALALARRLSDAELPGEADDAVAMAELAAARAPHLAAAHLALAEVHLDRGRLVEAVKASVIARTEAPSSPDVERLLGHVFLEIGEIEPGLATLRSASTREVPTWRAAWDETRALASMRRFAEAESTLEAALDRDPHAWQPWIGRARFALERGDLASCAAQRAQLTGATVAHSELVAVVLEVAVNRSALSAALACVESHARMAGPSRARRALFSKLAVELCVSAGELLRAESLLDRSAADLLDLTWLEHCETLAPLRRGLLFESLRGAARARATDVGALLRASHETFGG